MKRISILGSTGSIGTQTLDIVRLNEDLKVTVQQIGVSHNGLFERQDDLSSVAYWYQKEPHVTFQKLLSAEQRWPR